MTDTKEQVEYIIQGMVESGELEYFNDENGTICLRHGKNWGKKVNRRPDMIAGKRIKWIKDD